MPKDKNNSFKCDHCDKKFKYKKDANKHIKKHFCELCQIYTQDTFQTPPKSKKNTTVNRIAIVKNPTPNQPFIIFKICYHQIVGKLKIKKIQNLSSLTNKLENVTQTPQNLKIQLRNPVTTAKINKSGFIQYVTTGDNFENSNRAQLKIIRKINKVTPHTVWDTNESKITNITATTFLPEQIKLNFNKIKQQHEDINAIIGYNSRIKIESSVFTIFPTGKILIHVQNETNFHPHLQQLVHELHQMKAIISN